MCLNKLYFENQSGCREREIVRLRDGWVGLLHTLACYQVVLHVRRRSWPFCHSVGSNSVVQYVKSSLLAYPADKTLKE